MLQRERQKNELRLWLIVHLSVWRSYNLFTRTIRMKAKPQRWLWRKLNSAFKKSYDLYRMLLLFLVGLRERAIQRESAREARVKRLGTPAGGGNDKVMIENRFLTQLAENKALKEFAENQKVFLTDDETSSRKSMIFGRTTSCSKVTSTTRKKTITPIARSFESSTKRTL